MSNATRANVRKQHPDVPHMSRLELWLCMLAACGGVAAAAYLYWTVHWIAAVVITVYLWILITEVCVTGRESVTWYLLDFLHHLLSFAGTAMITSSLCRIDWRIGTMAILPVLILLLAVTHGSILSVYGLVRAARAAEDAQRRRCEQNEMCYC